MSKDKTQKNGWFKKKPAAPKSPIIKHRGLRRPVTLLCWTVLIGSTSFGVYKNITAIDTHTVHEVQVIKTKVIDTHALATFTTDFAKLYYSWQPSHEALDQRQKALQPYFVEQLQSLNADTVRSDIPTTATVNEVKVWDVSKTAKDTFRVLFTVKQDLTKGKDKKTVTSTYTINVMQNDNGDMVVTKNPTIAAEPATARIKLPDTQSDNSVDSSTADDVTKFLKTFFTLYPKSDRNELKYYVKDGTRPIERSLKFVELLDPVFKRTKSGLTVTLSVKYLDTESDMNQVSQYRLNISKNNKNWIIITGI
ncbi:conjugal transfer protein [Lacticaseibacillus rhamnosus]|uniref:conjugal transfer protein n=1 Tax=Lacticaseibacillus rhamnosus TaxID=47715 RepID=UPI0021A3B94A|nr:conjugal transfer protein [Lacticaseibacillus rhamnosus]MCT3192159.1 conjugal transfer protein [Lacticaseibacillus rhamnosus]MCT3371245.1 conjugal transfer protein [Lacticaseibacillus rhamnosus]